MVHRREGPGKHAEEECYRGKTGSEAVPLENRKMMKYEANQVTTAPSGKEVRSKADIKPLLKSVG